MRNVITKTIDDKSYQFKQFNTTTSLQVLSKLTKLLGEPILLSMKALGIKMPEKPKMGKLVNGLPEPVAVKPEEEVTGEKLLKKKLDPAMVTAALTGLLDRIEEPGILELVKTFTTVDVTCDGNPINFDDHFGSGGLEHLFKVVKAAAEAQYGNFLNAVIGPKATSKVNGADPQSTQVT